MLNSGQKHRWANIQLTCYFVLSASIHVDFQHTLDNLEIRYII